MSPMTRTPTVTRLARAAAACGLALLATSARAQVDFRTYVALGDSLTAGFSSGSLIVTHQSNSFPAVIARQAGVASFEQPTVSDPGIPAELALTALVPRPVIEPKAAGPGIPTNLALAAPYDNLGIPGAIVADLLTRTSDNNGYHDLILRGRGTTALQQGLSRGPSFLTLWIGNNDVLGAAVRGRAIDGVTLTPAGAFRAAYTAVVEALVAADVQVIAANLPDVTTIPFVTTIPPYVVDPSTGIPVLVDGERVALLGPDGPLPAGTFVTLAASSLLAVGDGIPSELGGRGTRLPDEVVLDAGEVAAIRERVATNNRTIAEICAAAGIPVLDANALLAEVATTGRVVGGVRLTNAFLTGGIFSYDGVHPTDLGYAVIANEWIRVINENGGDVPPMNLAPMLGLGARVAAPAPRPAFFEFTREAWEELLTAFPLVAGR
jgi:lysophospholipase L1-like esterase